MRAVRVSLLSLLVAGTAGAAEPSADAGRALFTGSRAFQGGGAPCGACHALGGEGMAFTASLGPELSTGLATMDPVALDGLLEALPFPSMTPVYDGRPLTPAERADLVAYLIPAAKQGPPRDAWHFEAWGTFIALLLFIGLALNGRRRKARSRARLIDRAYPSHAGGSR